MPENFATQARRIENVLKQAVQCISLCKFLTRGCEPPVWRKGCGRRGLAMGSEFWCRMDWDED